MNARILVIDHRDSFVFNLVEELARLGARIDVVRSDTSLPTVQRRLRDGVDAVLLSPGPGTPEESGVMLPLLEAEPEVPMLGICLGLQAMAVAEGGVVGRAPSPVHGSASAVRHEGHPVFADIASPFAAGRYHSLVVTRAPEALEAIAHTADDAALPMAFAHRTLPRVGFQFHPESVLTPCGPRLVESALRWLTSSAPRRTNASAPSTTTA